MQNQQASITNGSYFASSADLSVVRMPTLLAVSDVTAQGFMLEAAVLASTSENVTAIDAASMPFLTSEDGVAVWSELDGSMKFIDGQVRAYMMNTMRGPVISFFAVRDGALHFSAKIRCVDLLGLAPGSKSESKMNEYRDLLAAARVHNIRVLH